MFYQVMFYCFYFYLPIFICMTKTNFYTARKQRYRRQSYKSSGPQI